jgi:hypothetical protein
LGAFAAGELFASESPRGAFAAGEAPEEVWRNWFLRAYRHLPEVTEDKAG